MRLGPGEHGDRVRAVEAGGRGAHGVEQVAAVGLTVEVVHQVGDHLGIGLRFEHVAERLQLGAQCFVVLDDAVVHHRDLAAGEVRVRVARARRAMRRPAGVRDAGAAGHALVLDLRLQLGDTLRAARAHQLALAVHGHAAGVVAAVLEAAQALDKDGDDVTGSYAADDAAHGGSGLRAAGGAAGVAAVGGRGAGGEFRGLLHGY